MVQTKEQLLKERFFYHFNQICQIPHPSGGEKALSDFILNWALQEGLEAKQDSVHNVFIRKNASPGYETAPGVMLQAHLDMVCEKAAGITHDFSKDPISWVIEEDLLSTGGATTLGADDGIGVAYAMAILENRTLKHPKLEVLFTVSEESDFTGAENFNTDWMESGYLINLDHACDDEILCGSCGGTAAEVALPLQPENIPEEWQTYTVTVSGLKGGHSGEDIHRGHGNANVLLGRILLELEKNFSFGISGLEGGSYRLAIPRDAKAQISINPSCISEVKERLESFQTTVRREFKVTGDSLSITLEDAPRGTFQTPPDKIITLILLSCDGISQMNEMLTGLVDTSDNLGELHMDSQTFRMVFEIRAAEESSKSFICEKLKRLASCVSGKALFSTSMAYPSWYFLPHSRLRELAKEVYQAHYQEEAKILTVHAGLEVGCFFQKKPELDAIAIGPNCWNFHSPSEMISISSARKSYQYLCAILERLCETG